MRIVGGRWRGTALAGVGKGDPAAHLRPTSDRVRESLFNILAHGGPGVPLEGARVLDLFAGTGALGLEALSRGAAWVTFVDNGRAARRLIGENVGKLRAEAACRLIARDARRPGVWAEAPHELVFLDPPYGQGLGEAALARCLEGGWIAPGAGVVWEDDAPHGAPPGFGLVDHRRFGQTHVTLLRVSGGGD